MPNEYMSLTEAAKELGVSRTKAWSLVKEGTLKTFANPLDKRESLVLRADVAELKNPTPKTKKV